MYWADSRLGLDLRLGIGLEPQALQTRIEGVEVTAVAGLRRLDHSIAVLTDQHHDFLVLDPCPAWAGQQGLHLCLPVGLLRLIVGLVVGELETLGRNGTTHGHTG